MSTEKKPGFFRYGIEALLGVILAPGTSSQRPPLPRNGLTRINTELGAIEFYLNGKWKSTGGVSALEELKVGNFTSEPGKMYPVDAGAVSLVKLPVNPAIGDSVVIIDALGLFESDPIQLDAQGSKIKSSTGNYTLDRKDDAVTLRYDGPTGWSVSHTIQEVGQVVDRFKGSFSVSGSGLVTLPVNTAVKIDIAANETVTAVAPATAEEGDEIYLVCINETGRGRNPAVNMTVEANNTLNGVTNGSIVLNTVNSWIHLKYLDGWKVIGSFTNLARRFGISLDNAEMSNPGKFYLTGITTGLPIGVPAGAEGLLDVIEGRLYSNRANVTDAFQVLHIPALSRKWERMVGGEWAQVTSLEPVVVSTGEKTAPVNSEIIVTHAGTSLLTVDSSSAHGDRLKVRTGTDDDDLLVITFQEQLLDGSGSSVTLRGANRTVDFIYSLPQGGWLIENDSNVEDVVKLTRAGYVLNGFDTDFILRSRTLHVNLTGTDTPHHLPDVNKVTVECTKPESFATELRGISDWGICKLTDTATGTSWQRSYSDSGWTSGWRSSKPSIVLNTATGICIYESGKLIIESGSDTDESFDMGTNLNHAQVGDEILFMKESTNVLTLTGINVITTGFDVGLSPNTLSGKGLVSGYINNEKKLVIVSSSRRD